MEHKGKIKFQKTNCTQIGWLNYRICNPEDTRNIALVDNEANAKELAHRWNAFEEGGLVDELRAAADERLHN